jgi:hypothetical protein
MQEQALPWNIRRERRKRKPRLYSITVIAIHGRGAVDRHPGGIAAISKIVIKVRILLFLFCLLVTNPQLAWFSSFS